MSCKRKSKRPVQAGRPESIPILNPNAAGMDIGADEIYLAVPADRDGQPVQRFGTFTGELGRLSEWLQQCRIETVAMEAPAGSAVVFESRVWHRTGFNRTKDQRRAGVFSWYTRPIYRTQENWFLSLDPAVRQFASDDMLVLLGYRTQGLGLVNGRSPA